MDNEKNTLPEAPVTMFTNYKRVDGFEVSVTLRGSDLREVSTLLDSAIKGMIASGGTPVVRQNGFPRKEKPPVEYVEGKACPKCGEKVIKGMTKQGKPFEKCSTQRYDFKTGERSGCDYTNWDVANYQDR